MSEVRYGKAGQLKEGSYILIEEVPCKITRIDISKPGKHGSAKCRIEARGLFDGKNRNDLYPSTEDVKIPVIEKTTAQILADVGASFQLMDMQSYETFELPKPEPGEVEGELAPGKEVELMKYGSNLKIARIKSE
ncbi:MAG TPA: translation initiation factor IF-5A [archaeon]|nr:translation initiation factor IF-5A [archaeon]HLD80473.1 translation initiation factor IF-5A [archaeon]